MSTLSPTTNVKKFPFADLPKLSSEKLLLQQKLQGVFATMQNHQDWFQTISQAITEISGATTQVGLLSLEQFSFEEVMQEVPERNLIGVVRLEPQGKRAFLLFDNLLAQSLVNSVLTSGRAATPVEILDELRPITPLSEAVLQYIMVLTLEKLTEQHKLKCSCVFEDVVRDAKRLTALAAHSEKYALISLSLSFAGREFYIKVALPLYTLQNTSWEWQEQARLQAQQRFSGFMADFHLVAGSVMLDAAELAELSVGDIIFLDECHLQGDALLAMTSKNWRGTLEFRPSALGESSWGYRVELQSAQNGLRTVVKEAL